VFSLCGYGQAALPVSGEIMISGRDSANIFGLPLSFFQVGSNNWNFSSMTITENTDTSPVPEASSLALLGTGVLGIAETIWRDTGSSDKSAWPFGSPTHDV
jgi:hypothetical protein